ncbi:MAG: YfhO family protein, partial [Anaerolineales bacterium]
ARWITSDQFELEITSSAPGFVVASVPYMPGWKAFDQDRIEVPGYQAQMALMGTYVPAGKTNLQFIYSPDSYVLGQWVRGVAFFVSAIGFSFVIFKIWDRRRVKR